MPGAETQSVNFKRADGKDTHELSRYDTTSMFVSPYLVRATNHGQYMSDKRGMMRMALDYLLVMHTAEAQRFNTILTSKLRVPHPFGDDVRKVSMVERPTGDRL